MFCLCFCVCSSGNSSLAKYLGSIDNKYFTLFMDSSWRDFFDKTDRDLSGKILKFDTRYYYNIPSSLVCLSEE